MKFFFFYFLHLAKNDDRSEKISAQFISIYVKKKKTKP
jgi:hypothetical protein